MSTKRRPPIGNVRRVISLGNNFRGVITNKGGHLVQFESEQERKLILLLERDPSVAVYISQPETLAFVGDAGRQRRYTPDFQVWRISGQIELHEVTVQSRRESRSSLQEREAAARLICQQRGWRYIVHTDKTLPSGFEYASLDFLSAFRAEACADVESALWWLGELRGLGRVHPRFVLSKRRLDLREDMLLNCLYHLLWHGKVEMNWHQPFWGQNDFHPLVRVWLPAGRVQ